MFRLLNKISVRGKIIAAFTIVLCGTAGLGMFAIQRLDAVDAAAAEIRQSWLPATRALGQVAQMTERLRSYQSLFFIADGDVERRARAAKTAQAMDELQRTMTAYRALVAAGQGQQLADGLVQSWSAYEAQSKALATRLEQDEAGSRAEALSLFKVDMLKSIDAVRTAIEADLAFTLKQGQAAADRGEAVGKAGHAWILAALAGLAALCVVSGWAIVRSVSRPVATMTATMRRLAAQDMDAEIPYGDRGDEIGFMARAVQVFKDNALKAQASDRERALARQQRLAEDEQVRLAAATAAAAEAAALVVGSIGRALKHLSEGDLTLRLETALPPEYEALRGDLNASFSQLQDLVTHIFGNVAGLRGVAGEIADAAEDLSKRTEHQAASLEQTAAALDQITATVRKTADSAKQARQVASSTKEDAEQSGQIVRKAVTAMGNIDQSSREIGQIIGVIDEIAFQTNLLALNAGVEAARAGDAGRGFAVVASEVRALAQRSAAAAKQIKALVAAASEHVGAGVRLVSQTGTALGQIVDRVVEIDGVINEIAASAGEQATGLAEVNTAINQMDQVTQQNAAMVEESTAASRTLARDVEELGRLVGRFQVERKSDATRCPPRAPSARRMAAVG